MSVQSLTYSELAEIWGISKEAARKKVEGLRLPRRIGNDGKARVQIDLAEVTHTPKVSKAETSSPPPALPAGDHQETDAADRAEDARSPSLEVRLLQDRVAELRDDLERERQERTQERERADRLAGELAETTRRLLAMVDEVRELSAIRERLAAAERRHEDVEKIQAVEMERIAAAGRAEADRARAELREWRARPWWRRMVG